MAFTPGPEVLFSTAYSMAKARRYAFPEIPRDLQELLAGCTAAVVTSDQELVAASEFDTIVAIYCWPVVGGVAVELEDDDQAATGDIWFAHNFVPLLGPELYVLNGGAGAKSDDGWYVDIATDGDPVVIFYTTATS